MRNPKIFCGLLSLLIWAAPGLARDKAAKHQFTIVINTDKPVVRVGSDVSIKVQLTNNSNRVLDTSANISSLTGIDPNYLYDVRDGAGVPVPHRRYEYLELAFGSAMFGDVKPGGSVTEVHDINRLFDLSKPGKYEIQVSRRSQTPSKVLWSSRTKLR